MANKFTKPDNVAQLGGVQPWSRGGDMPWTVPHYVTYKPGTVERESAYLRPENAATGEKGPRFYFANGFQLQAASRLCDRWIASRKG